MPEIIYATSVQQGCVAAAAVGMYGTWAAQPHGRQAVVCLSQAWMRREGGGRKVGGRDVSSALSVNVWEGIEDRGGREGSGASQWPAAESLKA